MEKSDASLIVFAAVAIVAIAVLTMRMVPTPENVVSYKQTGVNGEYSQNEDTIVGVAINVGNVVDLYGAQISVSYDPNKLVFQDVEEGDFLGQDGARTIGPPLLAPVNSPGSVSNVVVFRVEETNGVSGSGTIVWLRFTNLDGSEPAVTVTSALLSDSQGNSISSDGIVSAKTLY